MDLLRKCYASREEMIFHLRMLASQTSKYEFNSKKILIRKVQLNIQIFEKKRQDLETLLQSQLECNSTEEAQLINHMEYINSFYSAKCNVLKQSLYYQVYFAKRECARSPTKEIKSAISMLSTQKRRFIAEVQTLFTIEDDCDDINMKKEKLISEPLLQGLSGVQYLNLIHEKYYLKRRNKKQYLDVFQQEQIIKFDIIPFILMTKQKSDKSDLETTQEIIAFKFDKMMKQMLQLNQQIQKTINKYRSVYKLKHQNDKKAVHIRIDTTVKSSLGEQLQMTPRIPMQQGKASFFRPIQPIKMMRTPVTRLQFSFDQNTSREEKEIEKLRSRAAKMQLRKEQIVYNAQLIKGKQQKDYFHQALEQLIINYKNNPFPSYQFVNLRRRSYDITGKVRELQQLESSLLVNQSMCLKSNKVINHSQT